jgi:hypothetical protein
MEVDRWQADLLRDLFGNPFEISLILAAWCSDPVLQLASEVYENRKMPGGTLDGERLCKLADALESAGCTDPRILAHLREPGFHVRGCWVLDLLLGRS